MRLLSITLLFLLSQISLISQGWLMTQNEVNTFRDSFPSSIFDGSISIGGGDITYLDSLYFLEAITGNLRIENPNLVDLDGLQNLKQLRSLYYCI